MRITHRAAQEPVTGNTEETRPTNRAYFPALDGVRGLALLMVFANHYLEMPWGWAGVDVFFVLSGFLITGILFDTRDDPHRIYNFYFRRTLRIFPLYYGLILLTILCYPIFHWHWSWAWLLWPAYLGNFAALINFANHSALRPLAEAKLASRTFPHVTLVYGHFWSLCVEEQFYLVWPWIVFSVRDRRKLLWICVACLISCPLLRLFCVHFLPLYRMQPWILYYVTPFRVDALLLGALVALIRRGPRVHWLLPSARSIFIVLFTFAVLSLVMAPAARFNIFQEEYGYDRRFLSLGLLLIDLFSASLIIMALEYGSIAFRLFTLQPLRWMGRISYGAYIFHVIPQLLFIQFLRGRTRHWLGLSAALAIPWTLLIAWASFRWFESPFIRLKERWTRT